MIQYPLTPDYIRNAPDKLAELYLALESYILQDICRRLKQSGSLTSTAIEQIRILQRRGYSLKDIEAYLKKTLKLSDEEYDRVMQQAIADNQQYYSSVLNAPTLIQETFRQAAVQQEINAIYKQTKGTLTNLTQSMGFSVNINGVRTFMPVAEAYQRVLDNAELKVWAGGQSYSEAIRGAVKELADSGLQTVTYTTDGKTHVDQMDVAVRRAVMTGITQMGSQYSEAIREEVDTPYIEISAHRGARDKERAGIPWASHKKWQGKVYSVNRNDIYPYIYTATGWGQVDGLEGANCRHMHFPFWEGISERTWTDEQLKNIDPPPFTYNGRTYTAYEATQRMRQLERMIRKTKRRLIGYDAAGDKEAYQTEAIRLNRLHTEYKDFAKKAGLREQGRENIAEFGYKEGKKAAQTVQRVKEARFSDFVTIGTPIKGDAITQKRLYNELNKSDAGREAIKIITDLEIPVNLIYDVIDDKSLRGLFLGTKIEVYASNTNSVLETAKTIIHEANHAKLDTSRQTLHEEVYCFAQEMKHTKPKLTITDLRNIIKSVHKLYTLPWR